MKLDLREILNVALVWNIMRFLMDYFFGFYKKRKSLLDKWEIADGDVLDVGCGSGHFSDITDHGYLGIDFNSNFIASAKKKYGTNNKVFQKADVLDISKQDKRFHSVIFIGIIHHIDEKTATKILKASKKIAKKNIVVMEVIQEQSNFIGKFMRNNDRGDFIRKVPEIERLISSAGLIIIAKTILKLGPLNTVAIKCTPP